MSRTESPTLLDQVEKDGAPSFHYATMNYRSGILGSCPAVRKKVKEVKMCHPPLLNPDCAQLFGGFTNAVSSLANSSYNMYTPGQANPYPNRIRSGDWTGVVETLSEPNSVGVTYYRGPRPGGIIFFTGYFSSLDPGFATTPNGYTQTTGFLHEQEHAANHNNNADLNRQVDAQTINEKCKPKPVETQDIPVSQTTLVPPS
jgi:hypothetical protein